MRMVANIYSRDPFVLNFDVGRHWVENKWYITTPTFSDNNNNHYFVIVTLL